MSSPLAQAMLGELVKDIELSETQLVDRLRARAFRDANLPAQVGSLFFAVRRVTPEREEEQ